MSTKLSTIQTLIQLQNQIPDPDFHNRIATYFKQLYFNSVGFHSNGVCSAGVFCAGYQLGVKILYGELRVPGAVSVCTMSHEKGSANDSTVIAFTTLFSRAVRRYAFSVSGARSGVFDQTNNDMMQAIDKDIYDHFAPVFDRNVPKSEGIPRFSTPNLDKYLETMNTTAKSQSANHALISRLSENTGLSLDSIRTLAMEKPDYKNVTVNANDKWSMLPDKDRKKTDDTIAIDMSLVACIDHLMSFMSTTMSVPREVIGAVGSDTNVIATKLYDLIRNNQNDIKTYIRTMRRNRDNSLPPNLQAITNELQTLGTAAQIRAAIQDLTDEIKEFLQNLPRNNLLVTNGKQSVSVRVGELSKINYPQATRAVVATTYGTRRFASYSNYDASKAGYYNHFATTNLELFSSYLQYISLSRNDLAASTSLSTLKGIIDQVRSVEVVNQDDDTEWNVATRKRIEILESKKAVINEAMSLNIVARNSMGKALDKTVKDSDNDGFTKIGKDSNAGSSDLKTSDTNIAKVLSKILGITTSTSLGEANIRPHLKEVTVALHKYMALMSLANVDLTEIPINNMNLAMLSVICFGSRHADQPACMAALTPLWNAFHRITTQLVNL